MKRPNKEDYYRELQGVISTDTNKPQRFDYTQYINDLEKYIDYLESKIEKDTQDNCEHELEKLNCLSDVYQICSKCHAEIKRTKPIER